MNSGLACNYGEFDACFRTTQNQFLPLQKQRVVLSAHKGGHTGVAQELTRVSLEDGDNGPSRTGLRHQTCLKLMIVFDRNPFSASEVDEVGNVCSG